MGEDEQKGKGLHSTVGVSEKLDVTVMRGGEVIEHVESPTVEPLAETAKMFEVKYCPDCGEKPMFVPIYLCTHCGRRYLARYDPASGSTVLVPMGKEEIPDILKGRT